MVEILPELIAIAVALIAVVAEVMQLRRVRRVKRLAFGPRQKPAIWTHAVPLLRVVGLATACWGFLSLLLVVEAQVHNQTQIAENEYKHLVLVVDVSPSMHLEDAGTDGKRTRRQRASDLLESLFNRIPMRQFKITVIGVYTDAKMLLEDSKDHEVVRHIMEKMPMWHAFKPGKTKLISGIQLAAKASKNWNPGSAYILLLTDGDTVPTKGMPKLPVSVKDFFVVGVGNPNSGTFIDGHQSRQDVNTLRQIANRLRGSYHNGNQKHLTSQLVGKFLQSKEDQRKNRWNRREWALFACVLGSAIYSILPILLHYFGTGYQSGVKYQPVHGSMER
ncbi:MAG: VWA domain-containing protein [Planctomycetota bacterium]